MVSQAITASDGVYQIVYKHKGKAATCTVMIAGLADTDQTVVLTGNAFDEVNFQLD